MARLPWAEIYGLLELTSVLLFGPKILALLLRLWSTRAARRFGGRLALLVSFFFEVLFSALLAPVMMLFHTSFVTAILLGSAVGWPAQSRGDRGMSWQQAVRRHVGHALLGVTALAAIGYFTPSYLPWILPVCAGLILAVPLAVLTSRREVGVAARRLRLFLTPEEFSR